MVSMPRSDYATCFFFFQKTFVFRKPNTPRVTAAQTREADSHLLNHTAAYNFVKIRA